VPRRDAQLCGDLVKGQSKPPKAMRGHEAVQAAVAVWTGVELIDECKLTITPSLSFGQHAFDERP
jgi:hypothetical protein